MPDPDVETRDPAEQRRLDDAAFRAQAAYLLAHSPFYQVKLAQAGFRTAESVGGLDSPVS